MNFKNNELLMLGGAFILGVFVDRYMNHRDIVTGEVKEGVDTKKGTENKDDSAGPETYPQDSQTPAVIVFICIWFAALAAALYYIFRSDTDAEQWRFIEVGGDFIPAYINE